MHEKGGLELAAKMDTHYSARQLYNMLEQLDVYDALKDAAIKRAKQTGG